MKKLLIATFAISLAGAMSASATTYSGGEFSSMAEYNGTYVAGPPGYEALSYASPAVDAVVGVVGPLGTLNSLSMSFQYSNLSGGPGNAPFAAFGISAGTWGLGAQEYDVISENGNQLIGTSLVHVWDFTTLADVPGMSGVTLNSILATFGTWEVMRAYAYVGDEGALSGSVDINSITVGAYEVPEPTTMIAGALLLLPFGASTIRLLRKTRTA
jgi:hypothetical protein